jgi:hypothetical protein
MEISLLCMGVCLKAVTLLLVHKLLTIFISTFPQQRASACLPPLFYTCKSYSLWQDTGKQCMPACYPFSACKVAVPRESKNSKASKPATSVCLPPNPHGAKLPFSATVSQVFLSRYKQTLYAYLQHLLYVMLSLS